MFLWVSTLPIPLVNNHIRWEAFLPPDLCIYIWLRLIRLPTSFTRTQAISNYYHCWTKMLKKAEAVPQYNWMKTSLMKAFRSRVESEQDVVNPSTSIQTDVIKDIPKPVWRPSFSQPNRLVNTSTHLCPVWSRPRANFSIDSNVCNSTKRLRKPSTRHIYFAELGWFGNCGDDRSFPWVRPTPA